MTGKSAHGCFVGMKQSKCFHYAHLCSVSRQQITKPVQLHCPAHELAAIPFTIIDGFVAVVLHGSSSFVVCIADRPLLRGLRLTGTILSNYTVVRNTILYSLCGSMRSFRGTPKSSLWHIVLPSPGPSCRKWTGSEIHRNLYAADLHRRLEAVQAA
jgi:hypothetical protein